MVVGAITAGIEAVSSKSPPPQQPAPGSVALHPLLGRHAIPNASALGKTTRRRRSKNGQTLSAKLNARTLILPNFPQAGSRSGFSHVIPAPKRHPSIRNAKGAAGRDKTSRQDLEIAGAGLPAPFRVLDSAALCFGRSRVRTYRFRSLWNLRNRSAAHATIGSDFRKFQLSS